MSANNKIKVAIKSRPLLKKELDLKLQPSWKIRDNKIKEAGEINAAVLEFDHIFDENISTKEVFEVVGKPIVDQTIKGFNGTIFAYGQTASGKTYTMLGDESNPGVMVLAAKEIFKKIASAADRLFLLRVGYIELYNERIYDLLGQTDKDNKQMELKIHELPNGDVNVNCIEHIIKTEEEMIGYLYTGNQKRKIGETKMNERSSRSHSIFRIIIESREMSKNEEAVQISVLNLVDLAGSEKASQTGATGLRLKEGSNINKSLLFLGQVINQLAEPASADKFISYRDSKLTRILQASLGGNALTAIICTINPTAIDETQSTLNFALRAKCIANKPKKNEVVSEAAMMKRLEKEVTRLKNELEMEKSRNGKIKIAQLESRINEENLKMLNASTISVNQDKFKAGRRRTWCPSSYGENNENIDDTLPPLGLSNLPAPTFKPQKSQISRFKNFLTPQVFNREPLPKSNLSPSLESLPSLEDIEFPDHNITISSPKTPSKTQTCTECGRRSSGNFPIRVSLTPVGTRERFKKVEQDFEELKEFANLEKDQEICDLRLKISELEETVEQANEKRVEFEQAANRCTQIEQSHNELSELNEKLKKQNAELEQQNREAVSIEFEFKRLQGKAKQRENELLELLEERDKKIQQLETDLAGILKNPLKSQKSTECLLEKLEREKCQIVDLELKLSEKDREIEELKQCQNFDIKIGEKDREILELTRRLEEFSDLEKEKMEISMKYELEQSRLEKENEDLKLDVDKFLSEINSMKQMASIFETELKSANNLLQEAQDKCDELRKELGESKSVQDSLQKEKDQLQCEYDEASEQMMGYLDENEKLLAEIENLKKSDEVLSELQIKYKKVVEDLENIKSNNIFEYEQVLADKEKLSNDFNEISNKYEALLESSQSDNDFKEKYESERMEKEKLERECDELRNHVNSKSKEIESLYSEKEETEKMNEILILDKETIQEEKEVLEQELQEIKEALQAEQTNLVNLRAAHEKLTADFQDISQKHESTVTEKENLVKSLDSLKSEYSELSESAQSSQCSSGEIIESFYEKLKYLREIEIVSNECSRVYKIFDANTNPEFSQLRLLIQDFVNVRQSSCTMVGEGYVISGKIQELPFSLLENQQLEMSNSEDSLQADYSELKEKYEKLIIEFSEFKEKSFNEDAVKRELEGKITSLTQIESVLKTSLEEATKAHDRLTEDLKTRSSEYEQLLVDSEELKKKYEVLEDEKSLKIKDLEETQIKFDEISNQFDEVQNNCKVLETEKSDLQHKLDEISRNFEILKEENSGLSKDPEIFENLKAKIDDISKENDEWKIKYENCVKEKEELDEVCKSQQDWKQKYEEFIIQQDEIKSNYEKDLEEASNLQGDLKLKFDACNKEKEELEALCQEKEKLIETTSKLHEDLQLKFGACKKEKEELEALCQEKEKLVETTSKLQEDLELKYDACKKEKEELDALFQEKVKLIESLEEEVSRKEQSADTQVLSMQKILKDCEEKNLDLQESLKSSQNLLETKSTEFENLSKELQKASDELNLKSTEFEKLSEYSKELQIASDELKIEFQKKEDELKATNVILSRTKEELEVSLNTIDQKSKELISIEEKLQESTQNIQEKTAEFETNFMFLQETETKLKDTQQRESDLELQLINLKNQYEDLKLCIQNESSEALLIRDNKIEELNSVLASKEDQFQKDLKSGQKTVEDLKNQINDYKQNILKLETENFQENEKIGRLSKLVKVLEDESKTKDSKLENIFREASNYQNISKKLEAECQELKAHLESLKNTNLKLDQALNDKQKEFDAIAKKLEHLEHVEKEMATLRPFKDQSQKLQLDLEVLEMSNKELEEKQHTLQQELHEKDEKVKLLQKTVDDLKTTRNIIESKMKTSEHTLRQQINALQAEKENLMQRTISPLGSVNCSPTKQKLLDENDVLKKKNHNLCIELDKEKKLTLSSRKSRRQSTHDERRSYCFGNSNDVEIQTDPTSELCNCSTMNVKIKDLERKLLFSTKALECMKMEKRTDPFKEENAKLKKTIEEMETKQNLLRYEIKKQREAHRDAQKIPSQCQVCLQKSMLIIKDSFTEPEITMAEMEESEAELKKLNKKVNDLKYVCRERHRKNKEYEEELDKIGSSKEILEKKYEQLKRLTELRLQRIEELEAKPVA